MGTRLVSQHQVAYVLVASVVTAWLIAMPQLSYGLDIQVQFDASNSNANDFPPYDPDASLLGGLVEYAASVYEDLIEDNHVLQLTYRWDQDLAETTNVNTAKHDFGSEQNGREVSGGLRFDTDVLWFIDSTPVDDSEFDMAPFLFRDLSSTLPVSPSPTQRASRFTGDVPNMFEAGYLGNANATAPTAAQNGFDLLTIVFHEMGHALGMSGPLSSLQNEMLDGDFDVWPPFVGSALMAELPRINMVDGMPVVDPTHLFGFGTNPPANEISGPSVMSRIAVGQRRRPSAADLFAMSASSSWFALDLQRLQLLDGAALWHNGLSWLGGRIPDGNDDVSIRTGDGVLLGSDGIAGKLLVDDSSTLFTGGNLLWAIDQATVGGDGQGEVVIGGLFGPVGGGSFQGSQLTINTGGTVRLNGGSTLPDAAEVNMLAVELAGAIATNASTQGLWNSATEVVGDSAVSVGDGGQLALNGNLSGAADITKTGPGTLVINGGNGSWTGDLILQEGRINFDSANALSDSNTLQLADNTVADFRNDSETFGALQGSGTVLIGATNPFFDRQVVVGVNNLNTVFTGRILSPMGSFAKGGIGSFTLGSGASVDVAHIQSRDGGSLVISGGSIRAGLLDTEADFGPFGIVRGSTVRVESGSMIASQVMVNPSNRVQIAGGSLSSDQMIAVDESLLQITSGMVSAAQIDLLNGGQFDFDGGILHVETFNGDLVNSGGTLAPGESAGSTLIVGAYTQQTAAKLEIEIGGLLAGKDHDVVNVTGNASLDGNLTLALIKGFVPMPLQTFTVFDAGNLLNAFSNVANNQRLDTISGTGSFLVHYGLGSLFDPNQVVLSDFQSTLIADFDVDGGVDGVDFLKWQQGESPNPLSTSDLANWEASFGTVAPLSTISTTVPEPTTGVMLLVALMAMHCRRTLTLAEMNIQLIDLSPRCQVCKS